MDEPIQEEVILGLDLSTTCTGWAVFGAESKKLYRHGIIKGSTAGTSKMGKLRATLFKMKKLADQIAELVAHYDPVRIVIEEIAGSKNRLGQKTLDGFHFIVLDYLEPYLDRIIFYDVTGAKGWRTNLNLRLSEADKAANKEAKKLNKKLSKAQQIPIIGPKHLSARFVNANYNMDLNVDLRKTDADVADAITMTHAYVNLCFTKV